MAGLRIHRAADARAGQLIDVPSREALTSYNAFAKLLVAIRSLYSLLLDLETKRIKKGALYKALGCERGVLVDLVGLHAPVTSRQAFSRGLSCSLVGVRTTCDRASGSPSLIPITMSTRWAIAAACGRRRAVREPLSAAMFAGDEIPPRTRRRGAGQTAAATCWCPSWSVAASKKNKAPQVHRGVWLSSATRMARCSNLVHFVLCCLVPGAKNLAALGLPVPKQMRSTTLQ